MTRLFVWNPKRWNWESLEKDIQDTESLGSCTLRWSCGNTRTIQVGDRIFLVKVGTEPKGIIGSGFALTEPFLDIHWNGTGKEALYVDVEFEVLLNPEKEPILSLDLLETGDLSKQHWTPQSSGISIKLDLVDELEALWFDFLATQKIRHNPFKTTLDKIQKNYWEGNPTQVTITKYERNPFARKKCIEHYGCYCYICGFNFEDTYGAIGKDFIQVHHLQQIATIGKTYEIDPIRDLRPVCSNCHSMIHKSKVALTMEEMHGLLKANQ